MKQLGIEHQVPEDHDLQAGHHRGQALVVAGSSGAGAEVEVWRRRGLADDLRGVAPDTDRAGRDQPRATQRLGRRGQGVVGGPFA